jgi:hypothetical protein
VLGSIAAKVRLVPYKRNRKAHCLAVPVITVIGFAVRASQILFKESILEPSSTPFQVVCELVELFNNARHQRLHTVANEGPKGEEDVGTVQYSRL